MGAVTLILNTRQRIVGAYAGDANGQLWRFDLRGQPTDWRVSYNKPLFITQSRRPIYAGPAWQAHPKGGAIVVVATGMLLDEADAAAVSGDEAVYGVWDPTSPNQSDDVNFTTVAPEQLLVQSMLSFVGSQGTDEFYSATENKIDWKVHRGWRFGLGTVLPGERSIHQIANVGSSVMVSTVAVDARNPAESCATTTAASSTYLFNALDGRYKPSFDIDGDGRLDGASIVINCDGGYGRNTGIRWLTTSTSSFERQATGTGRETSTGCERVRFQLVGTGAGSNNGGVDCETPGWSRQQYQLMQAPR